MKYLAIMLVLLTGCAIKTQVRITTEIDGPGLPKAASEYTAQVQYGLTGTERPPEYRLLFGTKLPGAREMEFASRTRILGVFEDVQATIFVSAESVSTFGPMDLTLVVTEKYDAGPGIWRYIQAVDLFAHALVFPTLPYIRSKEFTIYVYDVEGLQKDRETSRFESYLKEYTATGTWKCFTNAWVGLYAGIDDLFDFLGCNTWMREAYDLENERKVEDACFELMRKDLCGE